MGALRASRLASDITRSSPLISNLAVEVGLSLFSSPSSSNWVIHFFFSFLFFILVVELEKGIINWRSDVANEWLAGGLHGGKWLDELIVIIILRTYDNSHMRFVLPISLFVFTDLAWATFLLWSMEVHKIDNSRWAWEYGTHGDSKSFLLLFSFGWILWYLDFC